MDSFPCLFIKLFISIILVVLLFFILVFKFSFLFFQLLTKLEQQLHTGKLRKLHTIKPLKNRERDSKKAIKAITMFVD